MKVFAAGISTETNTFCPVPTGLRDFLVQRGTDALQGIVAHPSLDLSATWGKFASERGYAFTFGLMAWAQPSGITVRGAYEQLRDEMLSDLRAAMHVDVVLLMLHGAMVADGYEDCEEDMIRRVREIVGPTAAIGVELDLHCHLSRSMIDTADVVVTYKEYPHVDCDERAREVFDLAVATRLGTIRPQMALADCRMIGLYPTSRQPMRGFVDAMTEVERQRDKVLSVSFGHGFPFGDVPHMGSKMLVVTDDDVALAQAVADEFAARAYELRQHIGFGSVSLPLDAALSKALASEQRPVVVADQSDNPGAGAPADATFALRWLIEHRAEDVAIAIFYDPEVVRIAMRAGQGARLVMRLGGKMGPASGDPVDIEVIVLSMRDSYMHEFPQQSGPPIRYPSGDTVALRCGSIDLVVGSQRCQCFAPSIFTDFGIDLGRKQVIVVKSFQHFYGAFAPLAGEIIYMAARGAVSPDPTLIPYSRVDTSEMYPWAEGAR